MGGQRIPQTVPLGATSTHHDCRPLSHFNSHSHSQCRCNATEPQSHSPPQGKGGRFGKGFKRPQQSGRQCRQAMNKESRTQSKWRRSRAPAPPPPPPALPAPRPHTHTHTQRSSADTTPYIPCHHPHHRAALGLACPSLRFPPSIPSLANLPPTKHALHAHNALHHAAPWRGRASLANL